MQQGPCRAGADGATAVVIAAAFAIAARVIAAAVVLGGAAITGGTGSLTGVMLGTLLIVPGMIVYVFTRISASERIFNAFEWVISTLIVASAILALVFIANGQINL